MKVAFCKPEFKYKEISSEAEGNGSIAALQGKLCWQWETVLLLHSLTRTFILELCQCAGQ